jgi:predicted DNA-binding transcriptional regulator AlpA
MRKNAQSRPYPPDFVSAETLAYLLDCSVRSVQDYAKSGLIPKPVMIGNLVRWDWISVRDRIEALNSTDCKEAGDEVAQDEYSAAIRKVVQKTPKAANDRTA